MEPEGRDNETDAILDRLADRLLRVHEAGDARQEIARLMEAERDDVVLVARLCSPQGPLRHFLNGLNGHQPADQAARRNRVATLLMDMHDNPQPVAPKRQLDTTSVVPEGYKRCSVCSQVKHALNDFSRSHNTTDPEHRRHNCKDCCNVQRRKKTQ